MNFVYLFENYRGHIFCWREPCTPRGLFAGITFNYYFRLGEISWRENVGTDNWSWFTLWWRYFLRNAEWWRHLIILCGWIEFFIMIQEKYGGSRKFDWRMAVKMKLSDIMSRAFSFWKWTGHIYDRRNWAMLINGMMNACGGYRHQKRSCEFFISIRTKVIEKWFPWSCGVEKIIIFYFPTQGSSFCKRWGQRCDEYKKTIFVNVDRFVYDDDWIAAKWFEFFISIRTNRMKVE